MTGVTNVQVELPDGTTVDSFAAAEAAGFPVACQAFVTCDQPASVVIFHPILVAYPSCARCAAILHPDGK